MRIIGGEWKGHALISPKDSSTRPTADPHRERIFNILEHAYGFGFKNVLDLFAGTGALGLEALSRGAARLCLVDSAPGAVSTIERNVEKLPMAGKSIVVIKEDVVAPHLRGKAWPQRLAAGFLPFDLVFCDPPYGRGLGHRALRRLDRSPVPIFAPDAVLLLEVGREETAEIPGWTMERDLEKGTSRFLFYRRAVGS